MDLGDTGVSYLAVYHSYEYRVVRITKLWITNVQLWYHADYYCLLGMPEKNDQGFGVRMPQLVFGQVSSAQEQKSFNASQWKGRDIPVKIQ